MVLFTCYKYTKYGMVEDSRPKKGGGLSRHEQVVI